jgi:hypothetical protein
MSLVSNGGAALPAFDLSDFTNYSWKLTLVNILFLCVVLITVTLRCATRLYTVRTLGWDDGKSKPICTMSSLTE